MPDVRLLHKETLLVDRYSLSNPLKNWRMNFNICTIILSALSALTNYTKYNTYINLFQIITLKQHHLRWDLKVPNVCSKIKQNYGLQIYEQVCIE